MLQNFIRHSFPNQADVSDEQIDELFDLLLKKYDCFKSGTYCVTTNIAKNCDRKVKPKLGPNKKKKLKRAAAKALLQNSNKGNKSSGESQTEKVKPRKKKRAKVAEMEVDENNDD